MKRRFIAILVLICGFGLVSFSRNSQSSDSNCPSCMATLKKLKSFVLSKKTDSTLSLFTDSLRTHYRDFDGHTLKKFIDLRWINDKQFVAALNKNKFKILSSSPEAFILRIDVDYKKKVNEDGDGRITYFIEFTKINSIYKIRFLDLAD